MGLHQFNTNKATKRLRLKYNKNKYLKYGSLIISVIIFVSIIIYFSYSKYIVSNNYNVMQATVGDFSSAKSLSDYLISIQSTNTSTMTYDGTSDNNLRYYGSNPNNYIQFNGELWRIVGVMNNMTTSDNKVQSLVKIVRASSIGNYSWDSSVSTINSGYGVNEWSQADIMTELNSGAYWNRNSGNCYNGLNNATTTCDFSTLGLKSDSKYYIQSVVWHTGTASNTITRASDTPSTYGYERSTTTGNSACNSSTSDGVYYCNDSVTRTSSWTGNIGLVYPSDVAYATTGGNTTSRSICLSTNQYNWNSYSDCYTNNWLFQSAASWMITPSAEVGYSNAAFAILANGKIYGGNNAIDNNSVYPTLYLKASTIYSHGTGTSTDPYIVTSTESNYDYTGAEQTFTAPSDGYYKLETWGAQGGTANTSYPSTGGYGGYATGIISLTKNSTIYINVGGVGSPNNNSNTVGAIGGYNGGGNSGYVNVSNIGEMWTASGGGATHIATMSGLLKNLSTNKDKILLFSGGGGGGFFHNNLSYHPWGEGGSGGGYLGDSGNTYGSGYVIGQGGTQTAAGYTSASASYPGGFGFGGYGVGGNSASYYFSGGAGGYYGGSSAVCAGAGGGSGNISNSLLISSPTITKHMTCYNCSTSTDITMLTNTTTNSSTTATSDYAKLGNGFAKITYLGTTLK